MNNLEYCKRCIPWVYPFVYDDCCLTVNEQIAKITAKVNDIINSLNQSDDSIKAYVNTAVSNAINVCKQYTDSQISAMLTQVLTSINAVQAYAKNLDAYQKNYIDYQLNDVWYAIRNLQNMGNCIVIDPTTGLQNSLQNTLNNMYTMFRYFALTASRYDNLMLTADEYDGYHISAYKYDYFGLLAFDDSWYKKYLYMYHPQTGEYVDFSVVINWLTNFHKTAPLTATKYDSKDIEASKYDAYNISAYEYDFNGATLLN